MATAVLLEVSTTERLWGGRDALLAQVLQAWADASVGLPDHAATRDAGVPPPGTQAVWGLRADEPGERRPELRMAQAGRAPSGHNVEGLPLHADRPAPACGQPGAHGLPHLGACGRCRVPGWPGVLVPRYWGCWIEALGDAPEAHAWLELPEQFALTAELPALAESADALLWSVSRCLTALQGWLQARQQGALALELAWRHDLRRIDGGNCCPHAGPAGAHRPNHARHGAPAAPAV